MTACKNSHSTRYRGLLKRRDSFFPLILWIQNMPTEHVFSIKVFSLMWSCSHQLFWIVVEHPYCYPIVPPSNSWHCHYNDMTRELSLVAYANYLATSEFSLGSQLYCCWSHKINLRLFSTIFSQTCFRSKTTQWSIEFRKKRTLGIKKFLNLHYKSISSMCYITKPHKDDPTPIPKMFDCGNWCHLQQFILWFKYLMMNS